MYRHIFASLRRLVAAKRFKDVAVGDFMVQHVVLDQYIEPLRRIVETTKDDGERRLYEKRIKEWKPFLNPDKWNATAVAIINKELRRRDFSIRETEDVLQDMARVIWQGLTKKGIFRKIRPEDLTKRPSELFYLFISVVKRRTLNHVDKVFRLHQKGEAEALGLGGDEYEDQNDIFDVTPAPTRVSPSEMTSMFRGLIRYVELNTRTDEEMEIFNGWLEATKRHSVTGRPFEKETWKRLKDEGRIDFSFPTFQKKWRNIQKIIVEYFEKELGHEVPMSIKKKYKLVAAVVIEREYSRRLLARYVLGGVHEKYLSGDFASPEFMVQQILRERKRRK